MNFRLARPAALIDINRVKELAREILSSNLCRCTGYQNIVTAVKAAVKKMPLV